MSSGGGNFDSTQPSVSPMQVQQVRGSASSGMPDAGQLAARAKKMRSQGLSFAKEGLEFTLDIPDSTDVKGIFCDMGASAARSSVCILRSDSFYFALK
jgi:hypothetical protein